MIVKIHTIQVYGEQHTQSIQPTDNFEQTIRQNIQDSSKDDVYASGITEIQLTYDQRQAASENLLLQKFHQMQNTYHKMMVAALTIQDLAKNRGCRLIIFNGLRF